MHVYIYPSCNGDESRLNENIRCARKRRRIRRRDKKKKGRDLEKKSVYIYGFVALSLNNNIWKRGRVYVCVCVSLSLSNNDDAVLLIDTCLLFHGAYIFTQLFFCVCITILLSSLGKFFSVLVDKTHVGVFLLKWQTILNYRLTFNIRAITKFCRNDDWSNIDYEQTAIANSWYTRRYM